VKKQWKLALLMVDLEPVQFRTNDTKNPSINTNSMTMNKIKSFFSDPENQEIVGGTLTMLLAFYLFYEVMWMASALGLLN